MIQQRLTCYQEHIGTVQDWYIAQHRNWTTVDGTGSKWKVFDQVQGKIEAAVCRQQAYLRDIAANVPALIDGLCLTPAELKARLGSFQSFCPVRYGNVQHF